MTKPLRFSHSALLKFALIPAPEPKCTKVRGLYTDLGSGAVLVRPRPRILRLALLINFRGRNRRVCFAPSLGNNHPRSGIIVSFQSASLDNPRPTPIAYTLSGELLLAYGRAQSNVTRLRNGSYNVAEDPSRDYTQKNIVYFRPLVDADLPA